MEVRQEVDVATADSMAPVPTAVPRRSQLRGPSHRRRRAVLVIALAVLAAAAAVAVLYRGPIVAYLTHWKGAPSHTVAYQRYAAAPLARVAVAGDVGDSGHRLDATGREIAVLGRDQPYDALLLLGDLVYPSGDPARLEETVFEPFAGALDEGTKVLAILGNHDVADGHGEEVMAALGMPGRYWSERIGDVLIVGLDSNEMEDPVQQRWLEQTLASTDAIWKIVALHHPPYSAGYQGSSEDARRAFSPVFERYGVQLVLSGHDHDYQRSEPIGEVAYVVSGAAAGTRRTGEASFTAVSFSWHHFLDVAVFTDRLVVRAVNQDGRVADEVALTP